MNIENSRYNTVLYDDGDWSVLRWIAGDTASKEPHNGKVTLHHHCEDGGPGVINGACMACEVPPPDNILAIWNALAL